MMPADTPMPATPSRSPALLRPPVRLRLPPGCVMMLLLLFGALTPLRAHAGLNVSVEVKGISGKLLTNVLAYLSIEQQKFDPNLTELQLQRLHARAKAEIAKALQPFGYYDPQIKGTLQHSDDHWLARYQVDPGPPVHITSIDIRLEGSGKDDPEFQAQVRKFPLHRNEVLDQPLYEKGKQDIQRFASEHGYFDFKWLKSEIAVNTATHTAAITLHIDSGPRYQFGKIDFKQHILRPSLVQRFAGFKPGDPYNTVKLLDLQSALIDSNYFRNVEINPRRDLAVNRRVPIEVTLEPRDKHLYTVGVGYGTDTGPRGKLGWENRRVNDRGHRFKVEYNTSSIYDTLTANYIIPIRNPRSDQFTITTKVSNDYLPTSKSEIFLVGVGRSIDRGNNGLETIYLNYQTENYSIAGESGNSILLLPGISWSKVSADNRVYPMRGIRLLLDVRGANPALVSNAHYLQVRAHVKFIHKVFGKNRILLRGDVGATRFGSISSLPPSQRFFAGGDQSVRGYAYNSLGPRNAAGEVVGGEQLLVGSVEYEQRFTDKWSGAVFYDTGNAINNWQDALKAGAGFGVRYRSPVGPIRVDLGWALGEGNNPWHPRLHINVGPDL
jgi:translocation and assembly module TamA